MFYTIKQIFKFSAQSYLIFDKKMFDILENLNKDQRNLKNVEQRDRQIVFLLNSSLFQIFINYLIILFEFYINISIRLMKVQYNDCLVYEIWFLVWVWINRTTGLFVPILEFH